MTGLFDILYFWSIAIAFTISFALTYLLAQRPTLLANADQMRADTKAKQSEHKSLKSRLGGVAVLLAFSLSLATHFTHLGSDLAIVLGAGLIVFFVGLREDMCRDMSPKRRLIAAFLAAVAALWLSSAYLPRLNIPHIDILVAYAPVGIILTLIWSAGACHAVNLIDGLNGLSSGYSLLASIGLYIIAGHTGDSDIQLVSLCLGAALIGFLLFNWPHGKVFMGDAGAYAIGHILAWLGILLVVRNPHVSAMAILLILFWPVIETAFTIVRRLIDRKATGQPDRLHFHHLVVRGLRRLTNRNWNDESYNPLASLLMMPFIAAPIFTGVLFWDSKIGAVVWVLFYAFLFVSTYAIGMEIFRSRGMLAKRKK